jgi:hypothetical protein
LGEWSRKMWASTCFKVRCRKHMLNVGGEIFGGFGYGWIWMDMDRFKQHNSLRFDHYTWV